jgi:hypothetical protein
MGVHVHAAGQFTPTHVGTTRDITYRVYAHEISENLGDGLERASQLFGAAREPTIVELDEWRKNQQ